MNEKTFADRIGRVQQILAGLNSFQPAYNPSEARLSVASVTALLARAQELNLAASAARSLYAAKASGRLEQTVELRRRASLVASYLRSATTFKAWLAAAELPLRKLRSGGKPKVEPAPAEGESEVVKARRNSGERSYADVANHLRALLSTLEQMGTAYAPANPEITLTALQALTTKLAEANAELAGLAQAVSVAVAKRQEAYYDEEEGLRGFIKGVKQSVRAQYGGQSDQFLSLKGLTF